MNADESDAEELFSSVRTGDDFVRMLLRAVADPAEMQSFGDTLGTFAAQLARRDGLERERAFSVHAVAALEPLAIAHAASVRAARTVATARRDRWALQASLAAEVDRATGEGERLTRAADTDEALANQLDERAGQLVAQGQELRRREAVFTVADATARLNDAKLRAGVAATAAQAWRLVETVIDEATSAADRVRLQRQLEESDRRDAPLRAARDEATAALAARLDAEIDTATGDAARQDAAVQTADAERKKADERRRRAEGDAARLRADAAANDGRAGDVDQARTALVAKGVLDDGEDAAAGEERWTVVAVEADTDLTERTRCRAEIRARQADLAEEDEKQATTIVEMRPTLTETNNEHRRLSDVAAPLAAEDRLAAVVGDATVDMWARGADIGVALFEAVEGAENELRELAVATRADQFALVALGGDGLLPPTDDVARVWDVLTAARIPATSGWRWLAERDDPEERGRLLAEHPALAGGVVITDPTRVDDARQSVTAAGLDLRSIVAVGAAGDLDEAAGATLWAAPVHRGLYDEAWAADERVRIEQRLADAAEIRSGLEGQASADRELRERLRQFLAQCPAGHLDALAATAADLRIRIDAATSRRAEIAIEVAALRAEDAALERIVAELTERAATATRDASLCEDQVRRDGEAVQWRADAASWRTQAQALDVDASEAATAAEAARVAGDTAREHAAERRRIATSHREERDELPVVAAALTPNPATPIAVLRRNYRAAASRLETQSAGKALATELSVAEAREADAARRLRGEPADVVAEARAFSGDPAAGDAAARFEAQQRTAAEASRLAQVATDAAGDRKVAEAELQNRSPSGRIRWIDLPDELEPSSRGHAALLDRQVADKQRLVAEQAREAHSRATSASRAAETARSRAQILAAHQRALAVDDVPVDTAGIVPFDGSLEEAERLVAEHMIAYRRTTAEQAAANEALSAAVEAVRAVGRRPDYVGIGGAQTALAEEPSATLALRAADLARGLDAIRASIDAELAEVHKHRDGLIERLSTLVEQRLRLLTLAQRLSMVPDGLGDWAGKRFLTINFQAPDAAILAARMGAAIDAAVHADKRDPTVIVLDAVRSAVVRRTAEGEQAFKVTIMKPNAAMFDTTVGVERLATEFSGGQRLTAAILLYCTLASLRAYVRGQERAADPGVLFLDNPIGKANADYLLDLQIAVAERRGVQLLYTTGISDPEVQASFGTVARLRNDADLRRHLNYIVVDDSIAERLAAGRTLTDTAGYLSASRLAAVPPA